MAVKRTLENGNVINSTLGNGDVINVHYTDAVNEQKHTSLDVLLTPHNIYMIEKLRDSVKQDFVSTQCFNVQLPDIKTLESLVASGQQLKRNIDPLMFRAKLANLITKVAKEGYTQFTLELSDLITILDIEEVDGNRLGFLGLLFDEIQFWPPNYLVDVYAIVDNPDKCNEDYSVVHIVTNETNRRKINCYNCLKYINNNIYVGVRLVR